ncbi:MAG: DNA adenine methylase [Planctomycetota bacterium]|nr:DNA adenine methylase [Planctomycetota bacterium]
MNTADAGPSERLKRAGPFLKWAGGKGQLLSQFASLYPRKIERYLEPFVGSAAVFFDLRERFAGLRATVSDNNKELIRCYEDVRDDVEGLIRRLRQHKARHGREHYYGVRGRSLGRLSPVARSARLIYLNKTCYNGLYRVNARGEFNVPIGSYKNPGIFKEDQFRAASAALQEVRLEVRDFSACLRDARAGAFVYFDPPYDPVSRTASFTGYTERGFGVTEQERLAGIFRELDAKGCLVMLSNSDTPLIRKLYRGFRLKSVTARRAINSNGRRRGAIGELVVMNYAPGKG